MPIYRYRCTECEEEIELMQDLSEEKPAERTIEHTQIYGGFERECPGTYKRVYDTFQFHMSGR